MVRQLAHPARAAFSPGAGSALERLPIELLSMVIEAELTPGGNFTHVAAVSRHMRQVCQSVALHHVKNAIERPGTVLAQTQWLALIRAGTFVANVGGARTAAGPLPLPDVANATRFSDRAIMQDVETAVYQPVDFGVDALNPVYRVPLAAMQKRLTTVGPDALRAALQYWCSNMQRSAGAGGAGSPDAAAAALDCLEHVYQSRATRLNLGLLRLRTLPESIELFDQVRTLIVCGNWLSDLPPQIEAMRQLRELDAAHNRLANWPVAVSALRGLRKLRLSQNSLGHIPAALGRLGNLQHLDLSDTKIEHLPLELVALTSLKYLSVSHNLLQDLPAGLGALSRLEDLDIGDNRFTTLDAEIGALPALRRLDLWRNQLICLPDTMHHLTALQELNLRDNRMSLEADGRRKLPRPARLVPGHGALPHPPSSKLSSLSDSIALYTDIPNEIASPAWNVEARRREWTFYRGSA